MNVKIGLLLLILAGFSVAATGCGRRGDLDTPSQAAAEARGEKPSDDAQDDEDDKRFVLDGLIE